MGNETRFWLMVITVAWSVVFKTSYETTLADK